MDEIDLIRRAKTDDTAFTLLYENYFPKMYGYVMKRVGNREEAEDIVSHTFLKMVEKFSDFKETKGSFKSWLYKIATNTMIDYFRKFPRQNHEPMEEHMELPSVDFDPRETATRKENRQLVFCAISKLPAKYQQILMLKYYGDLEHEEVAAALEITVNHVGVLLHRALEKFEKIYNRLIA